LAAPVEAGATTLSATLSPVPTAGTPLVLEGGGVVRLAGRVVTSGGGVVALDRPLAAAFPAGSTVYTASEFLAIPAPELFPCEASHHAAATTAYTLAGEPIRLVRGTPRTGTTLRHGPMTHQAAVDLADALRAWSATPALLHADPAGVVRRVVLGDPIVARELNGRLAVLELPLVVLATLALSSFAGGA
jgi:hypothetical protein